jgi:hypothetical protein
MMRTNLRSIAVLAVTAGLVAACATAAAPTLAPTIAPPPAAATATPAPPDPTARAVATPTAAPSVGPMDPAYVTGHAQGGGATSEGTTRQDGDLTIVEGVVLEAISISLSDARVTGTGTMHLNTVGSTTEDGVGFQWGTLRIENAGGAWEGSFTAAYWDGLQSESDGATWLVGSGAYEGLTFHLRFRGHAVSPADLEGVILPAPPPAA